MIVHVMSHCYFGGGAQGLPDSPGTILDVSAPNSHRVSTASSMFSDGGGCTVNCSSLRRAQ
eukprot:1779150-Amphidinium_carterae.2